VEKYHSNHQQQGHTCEIIRKIIKTQTMAPSSSEELITAKTDPFSIVYQ
jgi:hypothetical protein